MSFFKNGYKHKFVSIIVVFVILLVIGFIFYSGKTNYMFCGERDLFYHRDYHGEVYGKINHVYRGNIAPNINVVATLSCDHKKISISGDVRQVINSEDISFYDPMAYFGLVVETHNMGFNHDYNFDGYNDMESQVISGSGSNLYFIYLYDPTIKRFVPDESLSNMPNIEPDEDKKEIIQYGKVGETFIYKWIDHKLKKIN